jgi:hypothetical protein
VVLPQAAGVAERGHAALGADARAGQDEDVVGRSELESHGCIVYTKKARAQADRDAGSGSGSGSGSENGDGPPGRAGRAHAATIGRRAGHIFFRPFSTIALL